MGSAPASHDGSAAGQAGAEKNPPAREAALSTRTLFFFFFLAARRIQAFGRTTGPKATVIRLRNWHSPAASAGRAAGRLPGCLPEPAGRQFNRQTETPRFPTSPTPGTSRKELASKLQGASMLGGQEEVKAQHSVLHMFWKQDDREGRWNRTSAEDGIFHRAELPDRVMIRRTTAPGTIAANGPCRNKRRQTESRDVNELQRGSTVTACWALRVGM